MNAVAGYDPRQMRFVLPGGVNACRRRWRSLTSAFFDRYRPELHYMRGPGPKWREKHGQLARTAQ
jgi:hypothetical protein